MSVYDLLDQACQPQREHAQRMLHPVPKADVVQSRSAWLVERCRDKVVLDIGCAGTNGECELFKQMAAVSKCAYGVDQKSVHVPNTAVIDLETADELPWRDASVDMVVAGEVLEHLSNPGRFLFLVQHCFPRAELVLTVPNAFSRAAQASASRGTEAVNADHVCWYSWQTLKTLVERHAYTVADWLWYNGQPFTAEGLIFVCRPAP